MKNKIVISLTLMLSLSIMGAMAQDFETGSSLMNTGSNYSSTVNEIGAMAPNRGRTVETPGTGTGGNQGNQDGGYQDPGSPIGDAVPFLLLLAAGVAVFRWRKRVA